MILNVRLPGELKFGHHKVIFCEVQLKIETYNEWEEDSKFNPDEYLDGVKAVGELHFDSFPIDSSFPVKNNAVGELLLRDGVETSVFNILLIEKTSVINIVPKRVKRYFWQFFVIGKPKSDHLCLFPQNYLGVNMNKLYSCTDFRGYWPVQVASIIVAATKEEAKELLEEKLKSAGIQIEDIEYTLSEINIREKGATILNDGVWQ